MSWHYRVYEKGCDIHSLSYTRFYYFIYFSSFVNILFFYFPRHFTLNFFFSLSFLVVSFTTFSSLMFSSLLFNVFSIHLSHTLLLSSMALIRPSFFSIASIFCLLNWTLPVYLLTYPALIYEKILFNLHGNSGRIRNSRCYGPTGGWWQKHDNKSHRWSKKLINLDNHSKLIYVWNSIFSYLHVI